MLDNVGLGQGCVSHTSLNRYMLCSPLMRRHLDVNAVQHFLWHSHPVASWQLGKGTGKVWPRYLDFSMHPATKVASLHLVKPSRKHSQLQEVLQWRQSTPHKQQVQLQTVLCQISCVPLCLTATRCNDAWVCKSVVKVCTTCFYIT